MTKKERTKTLKNQTIDSSKLVNLKNEKTEKQILSFIKNDNRIFGGASSRHNPNLNYFYINNQPQNPKFKLSNMNEGLKKFAYLKMKRNETEKLFQIKI